MTLVSQDAPPIASNLPPTSTGRRRWTRQECEFLEKSGILNGRYELIDGEIIDKMGQHRKHGRTVMLLISYLMSIFSKFRVQSQATMEVFQDDQLTNRPEPDVVALREDTDDNPTGADVLLAVEISNTTQSEDLGFKVGLYARAGVLEYWVLNVPRRVLIAYRRAENGLWREITEYGENEQIAPISAPNAFVQVSELLPPLTAKENAQ